MVENSELLDPNILRCLVHHPTVVAAVSRALHWMEIPDNLAEVGSRSIRYSTESGPLIRGARQCKVSNHLGVPSENDHFLLWEIQQ